MTFRRDPATEGMRLQRLVEAHVDLLGDELPPFTFRDDECESPRDRRSETRFAVETECEVSMIVGQDDRPIRGVVRDVSRSGLGVILPCGVNDGAEVMVRFGTVVVFGHIAFAVEDHDGRDGVFYAGITLRHVFDIRDNDVLGPADTLICEL